MTSLTHDIANSPVSGTNTEHRWATIVHLISLPLGFAVLLFVTRNQWFFGDEWEYISRILPGPGHLSLLAPHNEHWVTIPVLSYKALYAVFGLHTYLPYMALLLAFHVVIVHLVWRVALRVGANPWLATGLVVLLLVGGAGYEDLIWAFQASFIGWLAFALAALLLVDHSGGFGRRDLAAIVLLVISLSFTTPALVGVAVVGITVLLRRGWIAAARIVTVPTIVFVIWALAEHVTKSTTPSGRSALLKLPLFVGDGLVHTVGDYAGWVWFGVALLPILAGWCVLHARELWRQPLLFATVVGAPLLFLLIGFGRVGLGIGEAAASRYLYLAAALLIPGVAYALTSVVRHRPRLLAVALVVLAACTVRGVWIVNSEAVAASGPKLATEARLSAAAQLVANHGLVIAAPGDRPFESTNANAVELTTADFLLAANAGKFDTSLSVSATDRLIAVATLQTSVTVQPLLRNAAYSNPTVSVDMAMCVPMSGSNGSLTLSTVGSGSIELSGGPGSNAAITVRDSHDPAVGAPPISVPLAVSTWFNIAADKSTLTFAIPAGGSVSACPMYVQVG